LFLVRKHGPEGPGWVVELDDLEAGSGPLQQPRLPLAEGEDEEVAAVREQRKERSDH
jgi:hypothetical protein